MGLAGENARVVKDENNKISWANGVIWSFEI